MKHALFVLLMIFSISLAAQYAYEEQACMNDDEYRLFRLINEYRKEKKLPAIPLSASLCTVAAAHAWDLQENHPDTDQCNMHSWSDEGPWSACCYTEDHEQADCVWSKPSELTDYSGTGYEIAYFRSNGDDPNADMAGSALAGWKDSPGHNHMLINKYGWKRMKWQAMGVAIYKNYAVVWFGELKDPEGKAQRCDD